MKVVFTARVSVLKKVDTHINGRGERKVVIDTLSFTEGQFNKDHVHVFPKDWNSKSNADEFFAMAIVGDYFEFVGETYTYRKNNGELSTGIRLSVL